MINQTWLSEDWAASRSPTTDSQARGQEGRRSYRHGTQIRRHRQNPYFDLVARAARRRTTRFTAQAYLTIKVEVEKKRRPGGRKIPVVEFAHHGAWCRVVWPTASYRSEPRPMGEWKDEEIAIPDGCDDLAGRCERLPVPSGVLPRFGVSGSHGCGLRPVCPGVCTDLRPGLRFVQRSARRHDAQPNHHLCPRAGQLTFLRETRKVWA